MYLFDNPVLQRELLVNLRMHRAFLLLVFYLAALGADVVIHSLTKFIKQNALAFKEAWLDVLKDGITGGASVHYPGDDESGLGEHDPVWAYDDAPANGYTGFTKSEATASKLDYITLEKAIRLGHVTAEEADRA